MFYAQLSVWVRERSIGREGTGERGEEQGWGRGGRKADERGERKEGSFTSNLDVAAQ